MSTIVYFPVLIHSCDPTEVFTREQLTRDRLYLDLSKNDDEKTKKNNIKRYFRMLPDDCTCRKFTTHKDSEELVESGVADKIWVLERGNHVVADINLIWMTQQPMVPRIDLVTKTHIERAYTHSDPKIRQEAMDYIEEVHRMYQDNLKALIKPFKPDPYEGRCLFPFGPDERTEGGHE
jgi:hypothetical protein